MFKTSANSQNNTSTSLYSFAHISEPEVDTKNGQHRVYFENQTKWLAQQNHIKAVVITGDFMGIYTSNVTMWNWVKEGIDRLRNAGKVVIPVLGNHDAFYNETYDGGKSDYRTFLKYAMSPANISSSTPNYTMTLDAPIKLFFVVLTYQWWISAEGATLWGILPDQITWMEKQLNSTSLPVVIALHSPPTKFALAFRDEGVNNAVLNKASKHSNVFLILYGHDHERSFRIYEANDGHLIYCEGKLLPWSYGGQAEIQIYDVYTEKIKSHTFSPWLNKYFTGYEGDTFEISFAGVMKSKSGLLKRNDFSTRQASETGTEYRTPKFNYSDYISPPSSVDFGYFDFVKRLLPKHHKTFWLQTYRKFRKGGTISFVEILNGAQERPLRSNVTAINEKYYFYPNSSDTSKNARVSTLDWYSLIYFVNETAEIANVYLYLENGTLINSWLNLPYISFEKYGMKEIWFREYVRMDDYAVTNGTQVSFPSGTTLTLSNGTKIFPNGKLNLLDFGTLMLRNVTIEIGTESKVMDLYGGDSVKVLYLLFWPFITPRATFSYSPSKPVVAEPVTFNATDSYDPDGNITSYFWDFGDGTNVNVTDLVVVHLYAEAGNFYINLTITDDDKLISTKTTNITVKHRHDIAVTKITVSPVELRISELILINVTVENQGIEAETFNVTAFRDSVPIATKVDMFLNADSSTTITFSWNTTNVAAGSHTIMVVASLLEGETDTDDNKLIFGRIITDKMLSTIYVSVSSKTIILGSSLVITGNINPKRTEVNVTILYRYNEREWNTLATVTTNENGEYSYTWNPDEAGKYDIKAMWSGDASTEPDESNMETITVEKAPPPNIFPYVASVTVISIIALAMLIYFIKIRKTRLLRKNAE